MSRFDIGEWLGLRVTEIRFAREYDCLQAMVTASACGVPRGFPLSHEPSAVLLGHPEDWPHTLDGATRCGIRARMGGAR